VRKLTTTIIITLFSLTVVAQITSENLSPTDTLKAYIDAASRKDVAAMKSHLSSGTLKLMEDGAKAMNKNLDDMLKEESSQMPPEAANIKYSNEKVSGDTATVDMTAQGQTATMPLVKENGEWKLALDKFIQDMKSKMGG
jgi:predicted Rossmann fold nucleotide-binding protein DprA/Smf involved in DNA uptake